MKKIVLHFNSSVLFFFSSEELWQAVKSNDGQRLLQAIKNSNPKELDLDRIYEERFRGLIHYASENKSADIIRILLDNGASVNLTVITKFSKCEVRPVILIENKP